MVNLSSAFGQGAVIAITIKAIDEFSDTLDDITSGTGSLASIAKISTGAILGAGTALTGLTIATTNMASEGAKAVAVQEAFNNILGDRSQAVLEATRTQLQGVVSDMDIMRNSNLLFQNISTATVSDMETIGKASRVLAKAVGIDASEAYDRLVLGIAKGETELLDELGVKLDATVANRKYAESIGKSVGELTAQERATAALTNIIPTLQDKIAKAGDSGVNFADNVAQVKAQFSNLKTELSIALIPTMTEVFNTIQPLIPLIGEFLKRAVEVVGPIVLAFSQTMSYMAERIFTELLPALQPLVQEFMSMLPLIQDTAISVFEQLVPAIIDLVPTFIELFKAVAPFLPSIATLVVKVAELAAVLLSSLKPIMQGITELFIKWGPEIEKVIGFLTTLLDILEKIARGAVSAMSSIRSFFSAGFNSRGGGRGGTKRVNDFILRPDGQLIETHPNDTIMGFKGNGPGMNITIENIYGMDPQEISKALKEELATKLTI